MDFKDRFRAVRREVVNGEIVRGLKPYKP